MTSTGVSKTRESISAVMISAGGPNSMTLTLLHSADVVGIVSGEVDVVEDDDDGPPHLCCGSAQVTHHLHRMLHIEVVQGLVEQHVVGVLGKDHRHVGPLSLTAGEFVDEAILKVIELQEVDRLRDDLLIVRSSDAPWSRGSGRNPTSCRIVSRVMKWFSWRRIDTIFARSFDFVEDTSYPATSIAPASMPSSRPIIVSRVDLPAPLGPTRAVTPPAGICRSTGPISTSLP